MLALAQILKGVTLSTPAEMLGIARSTVKSHLDAIYGKTGTNWQSEPATRLPFREEAGSRAYRGEIVSLSSPLRR